MIYWCGINGSISRLWLKAVGHLPCWETCCEAHDEDYINGAPRATADRKFRLCIMRAYKGIPWPKFKWNLPYVKKLTKRTLTAIWGFVVAWIAWAAVRAFGWKKYRELNS